MEQNRGYVRGRVSGEKLRDSSSNYSSRMSSNSLHNFGAHKGSHEHHHFKEWKHTETGGYHFKNSNFIQAQHRGKRRHDQLSQQELRKPYSDVSEEHRYNGKPFYEEGSRKNFQSNSSSYLASQERKSYQRQEYESRSVNYHNSSREQILSHNQEQPSHIDSRSKHWVCTSGRNQLKHRKEINPHSEGNIGQGSDFSRCAFTVRPKQPDSTISSIPQKEVLPEISGSSASSVEVSNAEKTPKKSIRNDDDQQERSDDVELVLNEDDVDTDMDENGSDPLSSPLDYNDGDSIKIQPSAIVNNSQETTSPLCEIKNSDSSCPIKGDLTDDRAQITIASSASHKNRSQELPNYFIPLRCPHCHLRVVTFREYISHLSSQRHGESLRKVSVQHRMSLAKLRMRQRKEQKRIEAQTSRPPHNSRMNFCAICKLYHSESRLNHETTELHKVIKKFLMPYCPVCRLGFKSRMLYEKHVATLTHIKNKVNMEKSHERRRQEKLRFEKRLETGQDSCEDGEEPDDVDLNLDNFMILDAVGSDADGEGLEDQPVGQQWVKEIQVMFCDACQRYLTRTEPLEKALELHCRSRAHHQATHQRQQSDQTNLPEPSDLSEATNLKFEDSNQEIHDAKPDEVQEEKVEPAELRLSERSESEERLWREAEEDIGEFCDILGQDARADPQPKRGSPYDQSSNQLIAAEECDVENDDGDEGQ